MPAKQHQGYDKAGLQFITGCTDWKPDPNTKQVVTRPITCQEVQAWRCWGTPGSENDDKTSFHIWWMQNLPGEGNNIYRCDGTTQTGNWWRYLRGDSKNPKEEQNLNWWCNPNPPTTTSLSGQVLAGPLAGATVTLYTLEPGGVLTPVALDETISTNENGIYTIQVLPSELDGKTLVLQAEGGNFLDEATGLMVSFEGHSLYAALPAVNLNRPLGGTITPFTDMAFRLAQQALTVDPARTPEAEAAYYNLWVSVIFRLGQVEASPIDVTLVQPVNLYDGQPHDFAAPETTYALALAGLSQQAADAGISPADWIALISADVTDDGILNGVAGESARSLPFAISQFLRGPYNPLGLPDDAPDTPDAASEISSNNENLRYFLTSSADEDWFRFQVDEAGNVEILLTRLPANYDLYVYDALGQLLASSTQEDKSAETVVIKNVFPGDYYVRVVGVDGVWDMDNSYQLRFNVTGAGELE